jgi:hypothetical protein
MCGQSVFLKKQQKEIPPVIVAIVHVCVREEIFGVPYIPVAASIYRKRFHKCIGQYKTRI